FQAEDGIRDRNVTGVQTCALPIYSSEEIVPESDELGSTLRCGQDDVLRPLQGRLMLSVHDEQAFFRLPQPDVDLAGGGEHVRSRSEERRVGKEGRARWVAVEAREV